MRDGSGNATGPLLFFPLLLLFPLLLFPLLLLFCFRSGNESSGTPCVLTVATGTVKPEVLAMCISTARAGCAPKANAVNARPHITTSHIHAVIFICSPPGDDIVPPKSRCSQVYFQKR